MVWPYIIAGIALIAAVSRSPVAIAVMAAYVATQLLPDYMLLKFFVWQVVGTFIVARLKDPEAGALVIASGLCYPAAKIAGIEASVGSLPFVLSDIAAVMAVLIGARGGLASRLDGKHIMGWAYGRRDYSANFRRAGFEGET